MELQNNLEKKGFIISQHTGEICEWIDMFLSDNKDGILIIVTPPRYGKTEICKAVIEQYENVSYETYYKTDHNPSAKIHIFDDMNRNMSDAIDLKKNINIALRIKDTPGKKIVIGSSFGDYTYLSLLSRMEGKIRVLRFPCSLFPFEERYSVEYLEKQRSSMGKKISSNLMECEI